MRVFVLLAMVGAVLAIPTENSRIVGGTVTTIQRYPYMSNVQFSWAGIFWEHDCGGSLITQSAVLSAAHCYQRSEPSELRVVLGSSMRSSGGVAYDVRNIINHPEFGVRYPLDADVAILHLARRAVLSSTVATVRIASSSTQLHVGLPVTAMGWGRVEYTGQYSQQLRHVQVYIIDQQLCANRYAQLGGQNRITPGMACAGILDVGGKDTCKGDSGGPYIVAGSSASSDIVVGITSFGSQCARRLYPGVMARVSAYSNWIVNTANRLS